MRGGSGSLASYFHLISDPTEKMRILYDLAKDQRQIVCKSLHVGSNIFTAEAVTVLGSYLMVRPQVAPAVHPEDQELIIQFQLGNQKYICQVPFQRNQDLYGLLMSRKLFRVQRREFYRLKVPMTFRGRLRIENLGGKALREAFPLVDLSGGGCRIELPPKSIKIQANVPFSAVLEIPKREGIPVQCVVRHQSPVRNQPGLRWIGVQFTNDAAVSNRIAALVMDLHRELFVRI